ncbi:MAG: hypothetical protein U9Q76_02810, partial [candidate division WOR-3 bacterium]|nr:hypothetical protein [candidate division WOR-3 bacterium]
MMLNISLLALTLWGDILVGPFQVAEAQPKHHQVSMRAAMAADGRFAIAWVDSLQFPDHFEIDLFVRFFDRDGIPLTDAYKIAKLTDTTTWVYDPRLDMDSAGNAVLVWTDGRTMSSTKLSTIRFQAFAPDGTPLDSAKTLYSEVDISVATPVSLANNGEFAIVFNTKLAGQWGNWVQRFDLAGVPQDSAFLAHDTLPETVPPSSFIYPQVALNDAGDVVVTWLHWIYSPHIYPRFQVFDRNDKPILPWEPKGYRIDDGDTQAHACRPDPRWIDNDRFVVFWTDCFIPPYNNPVPLVGRVFSQKGTVKHPIRKVLLDSLFCNAGDPNGRFYTAVLPDGHFALAHTRSHMYPYPDDPFKYYSWAHAGGILGQVVNDEPWRRTTIFEVSAPFGSDTLFNFWDHRCHYDSPPAVAACNDRLVWVYTRFNPDTIFEAWAVITDWDMG